MITISFLIERVIEIFIDAIPNAKVINYGIIEQIKDILPNFIISIIMFISVFVFSKISMNIYIMLLCQIFTGVVVYLFLCIITKNESYLYLKELIIQKLWGKV